MFKEGPIIVEVATKWGDPEAVHFLCRLPRDEDPEGDCDTEYIFILQRMDFGYINVEDQSLTQTWSEYEADPSLLVKKSRFLKALVKVVKNLYFPGEEEAGIAQETGAIPGGSETATGMQNPPMSYYFYSNFYICCHLRFWPLS